MRNKLWRRVYYIKNCRIPLVLVTFDESDKRSTRPRPNVIDEIARCRQSRPDDTLVLQEKVGKKTVELPSNVHGQMVIIPFEQARLHELIPQLLVELRGRGYPWTAVYEGAKITVGRVLNRFLDEMDKIWDGELDPSWEEIDRPDYATQRGHSVTLDRFFQLYQGVFSAAIREKKSTSQLSDLCNRALEDARKCAETAWELIAQGKMRRADELRHDPELRQFARKHQSLYDRASKELLQGTKETVFGEKLRHFKITIEVASQYIQQVQVPITSKNGAV